METLAQLKQQAKKQAENTDPSLPFFRFKKGPDNKIDPKQPNLRFRFLDELEFIARTRYHWDEDISKPVRCNKTIKMGQDGKVWLNGDCFYCTKRKEYKAEFEFRKKAGTEKRQFCDKKWDLNYNLVCRIAKLNEDGTQEFKLLSLTAKDYLYPVAKGYHKTLEDFTEVQAAKAKPAKLTDFWWELTPSYKLFSDEKCSKDELKAEVIGFIDENGKEYDVMKAAPMDYNEAMKKRAELEKTDNDVEDYPDDEPVDMAAEDSAEYDENNPPF